MNVFTKRNALIGWIVMRIARRRLERKLGFLGDRRTNKRTVLAGLGLAAVGVGATVALLTRRGSADATA